MDSKKVNGSANGNAGPKEWRVKVGLAEMLKGGVIMDVTTAEQAKIAENAGACAVMALERVPSDIRKEGGVARMASIKVIREIMATVTIPVMAKVRIGHFAEADVLQALEVDFIDESEVLTPADEENHIWKHDYRVPFVCGARNLGEALRRIAEGAAMIRTKGEAGSGNVVEAVRHMRTIVSQMKKLTTLRDDELMHEAKELGAPLELIRQIAKTGKLPVPNFSAGGIATPADAALVRRLGAEAVFVGSGIFKSSDPEARAKAVVKATTHFEDPKAVLEAHEELGEAMKGLDIRQMDEKDMMSTRGWYKKKFANMETAGGAIFGTCAGAILLAHEVRRPDQASLDLADISVIRNGYGRQLASEIRHEVTSLSATPLEMVFIRAPIIARVGPGVEVLASSAGNPVLLRQGRILISTFHPELTSDTTVHEYFLRMTRQTNGHGNGADRSSAGNVAGAETLAVSVERR